MQIETANLPQVDFEAHAFVPSETDWASRGRIALMLSTDEVCELSVTDEEWAAFEAASLLTSLANEIFGN